jgi:hypothetical protein
MMPPPGNPKVHAGQRHLSPCLGMGRADRRHRLVRVGHLNRSVSSFHAGQTAQPLWRLWVEFRQTGITEQRHSRALENKDHSPVGTLLVKRGLILGPTLEATMIGFRIPAAAVFLAGLTLSIAAAENTPMEDTASGTWWQHHLWSQKFDTIRDPETTGSIASPPRSTLDTGRSECVPAGLKFSDPPLPGWRIGSCS